MQDLETLRLAIVSLRTAGDEDPPAGDPPPSDPPPGGDPPPSDSKKFEGALIKPGENATAEEKAEYQKALRGAMGVPATAEEYKFERPQWPEKLGAFPESAEKDFAKTCLDAEISPAQAQKLHSWYFKNVVGASEGMDAHSKQFREEAIKQLKGFWKDGFEPNVKLAERTAMFGADTQEDIEYLRAAGFMENPVLVRVLYNLGTRTLGDKFLRDGKPPNPRGSDRPKGTDGRPILKYNDEGAAT